MTTKLPMYTVFKANDYQPRRITALESKRKKAAKISNAIRLRASGVSISTSRWILSCFFQY
ncbi:hypothetical protein, partial [Photobacterium swingsii]|uniref:hypothetical protein n=1 Tax=Photobacterium swingsii TaxID=680026 RepID=UPI004067EAE9